MQRKDSSVLPLSGVRVVDLGDEVGQEAARLLADLGAEVVTPQAENVASFSDAVRALNKAKLSEAECAQRLEAADIVFLERRRLADHEPETLLARNPSQVVVVTTPFGRTGPRADWAATESTLLALSGALSRSGKPGEVPLLPPARLAGATAAAHAAWVAVVAHLHARRTGRGQVVDHSAHEALVVGLDPAFGAQGSAAAGRSGSLRRGRPPADAYPVYPCFDGHVRLCLLAARQWRAMFAWLGEPEAFADPRFDSIAARVAAADELEPLIRQLFADQPAAELVAEAARRGVPLAQVLSPGEALDSDHFTKAGTVQEVPLADGTRIRVPVGFLDLDGQRLGTRPTVEPAAWTRRTHEPVTGPDCGPLAGVRVLDLGVIVFGAEVGRLLADLGADVIKVESRAFPDGLRQTFRGEPINASFAWGNRGKRSLGLDLRDERGRQLFERLAADADVVLSNFKPGTLDALGIGPDRLAALNPQLVVLESAAFSSQGPWARRLGYGPLVRAACGVTSLWRYDGAAPESWDGVTVYPDHIAARAAATAVMALLSSRASRGRGGHLELAQSDVALYQFAELLAQESLTPGSVTPVGNQLATPGGVYACAGDDEWVVIDCRTGAQRETLLSVVGGRDGAVGTWTAQQTPDEATQALQALGIPAAPMRRLDEIADDPQLRARATFGVMAHPLLEQPLPAERCGAGFSELPVSEPGPAPLSGQQTREICSELLAMTDEEIDHLLEAGVLHESA
jgi:crotonobetainyl-CoA:carnitine CoA-transferase CaiB-like acyl-CoA transferase